MKPDTVAKPRDIIIFYAVTVLFWSSLYTYLPIFSPHMAGMGVSLSMIGAVGGAYGLTQMLLRIPLGVLSDKFAIRKPLILVGAAASTLSAGLLYFAKDPALFFIGRGLGGVAASFWVIITVLFASYFKDGKAASKISYLTMSNLIGQTSAMLAGGVLAGALGYRFPFLLGALAGGGALVLSVLIKENAPKRDAPVSVVKLLSSVKNRQLITMSVLAVFSHFIFFGAVLTFTPIVASQLGASATELGYVSTLGSVPRILSAMASGMLLARRFNTKTVLAAAFVCLAVGCALTPFCPNLPALYAANALVGFANGMIMAMTISLCTRDVGEGERSAAMGFFQAIYGIGMAVGPVVTGWVADGLGMEAAFLLAAFIALVAALLAGSGMRIGRAMNE